MERTGRLAIVDAGENLHGPAPAPLGNPWPASTAQFGPCLGEQARALVALLQEIGTELVQCGSMVHVLRRATFAEEQVVRNVIRYGFDLPHLLTLCGRLLTMLGNAELFETVARKQ